MGYDSIVGVSMVYVGAHLGFAGAVLNPFTIGIAQGLADIPLFSGIEYRMLSWVAINALGIFFVLRYAIKIKKNPAASPMYKDDAFWRAREQDQTVSLAYYTPKIAWFVFGSISLALAVFFGVISCNHTGCGQCKYQFLCYSGECGFVFFVFGYLSLKKSVHYFILLLLTYTIFLSDCWRDGLRLVCNGNCDIVSGDGYCKWSGD